MTYQNVTVVEAGTGTQYGYADVADWELLEGGFLMLDMADGKRHILNMAQINEVVFEDQEAEDDGEDDWEFGDE